MDSNSSIIKERTPYGTLYQNEPGGWFYVNFQTFLHSKHGGCHSSP